MIVRSARADGADYKRRFEYESAVDTTYAGTSGEAYDKRMYNSAAAEAYTRCERADAWYKMAL